MLDPSNWTETDLNNLINNDIPEDLHLDYKRSGALSRTDPCRNELSKDVAAFANSDGGIIIYGIVESGHHPTETDNGVDANSLTREWLEQIITSNIQPKIESLRIHPIPLLSKGLDRAAYVINIPQSKTRAPHQSRDKKYYKRYNFQSVPMEDYEIRDILRRASAPDLFIVFKFTENVTKIPIQFRSRDISEPIYLGAEIGNRSTTPAHHALIDIFLDQYFVPYHTSSSRWVKINIDGKIYNQHNTSWSVPNRLPIFSETTLPLENIMFTMDAKYLGSTEFSIGYRIRSPGCSAENFVRVIQQPAGTLWIPKQ